MRLSSGDQNCRYLVCAGGDHRNTEFGKRLAALGIVLPGQMTLRDCTRLGWIEPVLRIRIPDRFLLAWSDFPGLQFQGDFLSEDTWVNQLWLRSVSSIPTDDWEQDGRWYRHYLDCPDHDLTSQVAKHRIESGRECEPEAILHPRSPTEVYPWLDFFAYWQAFELADIVEAAVLIPALYDVPNAKECLDSLKQSLPRRQEFANCKVRVRREQWASRRKTFDWLSRFRTLMGGTVGIKGPPQSIVVDAVRQMASDLGLDGNTIKNEVRDVLLVLHAQWTNRARNEPGCFALVRALRQDIEYAVEFWQIVGGQALDFNDAFWGYPANGWQGRWTTLPDALPREDLRAKQRFPHEASRYLSAYNLLAPQRRCLDETAIEQLVNGWWSHCTPLRRFCLAFSRMHDHYRGTAEELASLQERTPIEFLLLAALHAEKLLGEVLTGAPTGFAGRVCEAAKNVAQKLSVSERPLFGTCLNGALNNTKLHNLPETMKMPFVTDADIEHADPIGKRLVVSFANYAVLRNYAAHHDCLDGKLIYSDLALPAIEALLVVTLESLTIRPPPCEGPVS